MSTQQPASVPIQSSWSRNLLLDAVIKGGIADFDAGVVVASVDREHTIGARPPQTIEAEDIRELMTGRSRRGLTNLPQTTSAGVRLFRVTVTGILDLDDTSGIDGKAMPRLEFTQCWFENPIKMERSRMRSLCIRGCRFAAVQASDAIIEGPVDISRARSNQKPGQSPRECWVVLAGAQIGGRINAAFSRFAAPPRRPPEKWVLYSKHSRYALDLRGTRIRGSINLRPAVSALGGVCITLSKVEGSLWANGANLIGVEDSAFAADYAEIQGSLYFRPYDSTATKPGMEDNRRVAKSADFRSKGTMSLFAAKIGGSLFFEGAKLTAIEPRNRDTRTERNTVVNAATATIGGHCLFRSWISELVKEDGSEVDDPELVRHFVGDGAVVLTAAAVGNDLDFSGAIVRTIHANNIRISGACKLSTYSMRKVKERRPFRATYAVLFQGATVSGDFLMDEARIGSLKADPNHLADVNPAGSVIDAHYMKNLAEHRWDLDPSADPAHQPVGRVDEKNGIFATGISVGGTCSMGITDTKDSKFRFECVGRIQMQEAKLRNSLKMDGAWVIGPEEKTTIDFSGVVVGGKATFMTWDRNRNETGKAFRLRGGEIGMKLTGAEIGQELLMNGAHIRASKVALTAENIKIGGKASLGTYEDLRHQPHSLFNFKSWGKISLVSASIRLGLDMSGAELHGIESVGSKGETNVSDALDLTRIQAKYVRMCAHLCIDGGEDRNVDKHRNGAPFSANGRVTLEHANIDTYLSFEGSHFSRPISAEYAKVGGAVLLKSMYLTSGYARSQLCELAAREAHIQRTAKPDIALQGMDVGGSLTVSGVRLQHPSDWKEGDRCLPFTVDLRGAHVGELDDGGGTGWGNDLRLWLEGFRYMRLADSANVNPLKRPHLLHPLRIWDPSWIPEPIHTDDPPADGNRKRGGHWRHRAIWLRRQYFDHKKREPYEFSPDAYEQVVKGMNGNGSYEDARHIASIRLTLDGENTQQKLGFLFTPFRVFFDYGFSVIRAILTFLLCLALGTAAAWVANYGMFGVGRVLILNVSLPDSKLIDEGKTGQTRQLAEITPVEKEDRDKRYKPGAPCGDHVQSFLYALDVFIPVLDLRQQNACSIAPGERIWRFSQASYAVLGWVITSLLILTASGLLRRHLEK